jgi:hypothetical protein
MAGFIHEQVRSKGAGGLVALIDIDVFGTCEWVEKLAGVVENGLGAKPTAAEICIGNLSFLARLNTMQDAAT